MKKISNICHQGEVTITNFLVMFVGIEFTREALKLEIACSRLSDSGKCAKVKGTRKVLFMFALFQSLRTLVPGFNSLFTIWTPRSTILSERLVMAKLDKVGPVSIQVHPYHLLATEDSKMFLCLDIVLSRLEHYSWNSIDAKTRFSFWKYSK